MKDTWDLTPIYPGCESEKFSGDIEKTSSLIKDLEKKLVPGADFEENLHQYELIEDYISTLGSYVNALRTTDNSNAGYIKALNRVSSLSLEVSAINVKFLNYLAEVKDEVRALTAEGGKLEKYAFVLNEMLDQQQRLMSDDMEALASDLMRSGSEAFSKLQESMLAIEVLDGETATQLRSRAYDADRKVRKEAFDREIELFKRYEVPYAAALNGVKGATLVLDKMHKYSSPLECSLDASRITKEILDNMIEALEENFVNFRRYLSAKAKELGLEKLAFYDIFAPVVKSSKKYTFEDTKKFILEQFGTFSPDMQKFAKNAFDNNWIDYIPHQGKSGGAYDTSFPLAKQSRVFCNFDESFSSVLTVAHELGHAYHDSVVMNLPALLREYPMTLAETASIFSEFLVFQGALKTATEEEKHAYIEQFLQDSTQTCVDIIARFYFEREVYRRRETSELTIDEFNEIMVDAEKKTYGDFSEYHPYMWAVKGHYYIPDLSFYNYPYAFGQLFALGIYASKDDFADFPKKYVELLSNTGCKSAYEAALTVGIDITKKEFWQKGLGVINRYIEEYIDGLQN